MKFRWGMAWLRCRKWLKIGSLVAAGWVAVYGGVIRPSQAFRGMAMEKTSGLAAIESNRHWLFPVPPSVEDATLAAGIIGGVPRGASLHSTSMAYLSPSDSLPDHKLVRTTSINLLVKSPATAAETIRLLTERAGGFLVQWQTNGAQDATNATVTVRVPVARFEEVRAAIRKLGLRIEGEELQAEDVTRQYVDQQARLHNLRAQEAQYLSILKHARTVRDTLEVSEKLNGVRSEIERQQAGIRSTLQASGNRCPDSIVAFRSRSKCFWSTLETFVRSQTSADAGPGGPGWLRPRHALVFLLPASDSVMAGDDFGRGRTGLENPAVCRPRVFRR